MKKYPTEGAGFYELPVWSPDSEKIAFIDNSLTLFWIDLESGKVKKIATEPHYGPAGLRTLRPAWSPDSKWIVYALGNKAAYHTVFAYDLATGTSRPITDGLSDAIDPVFDAGGKYLYFLASTDAGPVNQWFAQSNADMRVRRSIYLVVLKKGTPSPLAKEQDEEKPGKDKAKDPKEPKPTGKGEPVAIDFDGIDQRILAIPEPAGLYSSLHAGTAGQLFYLESSGDPGRADRGQRGATMRRFDLDKRKSEAVASGVAAFFLSADRKKALIYTPPEAWSIIGTAGKAEPGKGKLNIDAIEVRIEPRAEWPQIFDEAWRINRDYFYDPGMHGADWNAIRAEIPRLPASPGDTRRPRPCDSLDAERTGRWPQQHRARRTTPRAQDRAWRPARSGLRDRQRPLSLQEGVRRAELEPRAAFALDRARRGG